MKLEPMCASNVAFEVYNASLLHLLSAFDSVTVPHAGDIHLHISHLPSFAFVLLHNFVSIYKYIHGMKVSIYVHRCCNLCDVCCVATKGLSCILR